MMTPLVQIVTQDELRGRRQDLLQQVGIEEGELRRRAADYTLSAEMTAVLDEIDRIDYLLGA